MTDQEKPVELSQPEKSETDDVSSSQNESASEQEQEKGVVTMLDVLQEQTDLEENADAVLGGSDETNCTYFMGYMKRQALYSCKTCIEKNDAATRGGICLACSYSCHEGHELFELYTKRNFRCDCGIPTKFPETKCIIYPNKGGLNEDNLYNQNFSGTYCTCNRPYPDPENENEDQMIQCISCEDWFHGIHLGTEIPANDDYAEMICNGCMDKLPFLWSYYNGLVQPVTKKMKTSEEGKEAVKSEGETDSGLENSADSVKGASTCKLSTLPAKTELRGPTFWDFGWRKNLCDCADCLEMYRKKGCEYIIDETDTCHFYEQKGRTRNPSTSSFESGLSAMEQTMPRTQQIEMIHGFNDLQTALKEYLKTFAESGKVVSEQDIKQFFEEFKKGKANAGPVGIVANCR